MKPELSQEKQIENAVKDVQEAMLENIQASRLVVDATKRKETSRYTLLKAKDRLRAIEQQFISEI